MPCLSDFGIPHSEAHSHGAIAAPRKGDRCSDKGRSQSPLLTYPTGTKSPTPSHCQLSQRDSAPSEQLAPWLRLPGNISLVVLGDRNSSLETKHQPHQENASELTGTSDLMRYCNC
ncbi:hypothetical protein [Vacuolonema iberomarrocanum]|uniref:hypothetical protein n=1 Tax=Vacuolonema iberomarrocanum TaxID=3454632 RepID=UPI0019F85F0D|nr:hypothetical protein [filamentous cyanobacterium LEGE 07170]